MNLAQKSSMNSWGDISLDRFAVWASTEGDRVAIWGEGPGVGTSMSIIILEVILYS